MNPPKPKPAPPSRSQGPASIASPGIPGPRPAPLPGCCQPHPPATSGRAVSVGRASKRPEGAGPETPLRGGDQQDRKRQAGGGGGGGAGSRGLGAGADQLGRKLREEGRVSGAEKGGSSAVRKGQKGGSTGPEGVGPRGRKCSVEAGLLPHSPGACFGRSLALVGSLTDFPAGPSRQRPAGRRPRGMGGTRALGPFIRFNIDI